jgi:hypothetical protein
MHHFRRSLVRGGSALFALGLIGGATSVVAATGEALFLAETKRRWRR